jgi:hypothetical protein
LFRRSCTRVVSIYIWAFGIVSLFFVAVFHFHLTHLKCCKYDILMLVIIWKEECMNCSQYLFFTLLITDKLCCAIFFNLLFVVLERYGSFHMWAVDWKEKIWDSDNNWDVGNIFPVTDMFIQNKKEQNISNRANCLK